MVSGPVGGLPPLVGGVAHITFIAVPAVLFRVGRAYTEGLFEKKEKSPQQRAK